MLRMWALADGAAQVRDRRWLASSHASGGLLIAVIGSVSKRATWLPASGWAERAQLTPGFQPQQWLYLCIAITAIFQEMAAKSDVAPFWNLQQSKDHQLLRILPRWSMGSSWFLPENPFALVGPAQTLTRHSLGDLWSIDGESWLGPMIRCEDQGF